jgi:hypothetical protein
MNLAARYEIVIHSVLWSLLEMLWHVDVRRRQSPPFSSLRLEIYYGKPTSRPWPAEVRSGGYQFPVKSLGEKLWNWEELTRVKHI